MSRPRPFILALVLTGLLAGACAGPAAGDDVEFPPLHPDAAPSTIPEFEAAVREIIFLLDTELLEVTSPLAGSDSLGGLQSRLPLILPGIPPVFQRALERLALVPPPAAWTDDYARFIVEHRDLLQRRMRLFGALNADRVDIAAEFAGQIEERFASLQRELDPVFIELLSAFFDPRRYGGGTG